MDKSISQFDDRTPVTSPLVTLAHSQPHSGIKLLADPSEALQSRLHLAALATATLDIQYYLWQADDSGLGLTYEVLQAADRGVRVRILLDDIYHSGRDSAYQTLDAHPNVEVRLFNPMGNRGAAKQVNYAFKKSTLNYRMHNKIFLVDGVAAILGGRNIGNEYFGQDLSFNFQDMDAIALGDVAADAGRAFDLFWNAELAIPVDALNNKPEEMLTAAQNAQLAKARERIRPAREKDPATATAVWLDALSNELLWTAARVIVDRPDRGSEQADSAFMALLQDPGLRPEQSLVIQTAYLIPNGPTMGNIEAIGAEGTSMKMLTNSAQSNNHNSVHAFYAPYRKRLIEAGVDLYELQGSGSLANYLDRVGEDGRAGLHTKAMVFDERVSIIGSYNMDPRSRVWNSEIALVVDDPGFAAEVLEEMERDFTPDAAWRLSLDGNGKLVWSGESGNEAVQLSKDPGTSWWTRFVWGVMRLFPLENEL
ncbi:MAG: phospholipase D family protein [Luminiphilus sp.]|nr:phospholipase D family protein [Luminiphilus sp.]MDG2037542.1 phospholipase D family protein [Luminiphilus sp.]